MFIDPIVDQYKEFAELVGLCDSSLTRATYHQQRLCTRYGAPLVPVYLSADFARMLQEEKPDTVIVCTPDYLHADYIIRSLEFGADVISEKPLTTDSEQCRAIFAAIDRTKRKVRTSFNFRWSPGVSKVRELVQAGEIGQVKHVAFEYLLNTSHGADYFRRWHSQKKLSGGLLVHKSTHHFDLINWWLDAIPSSVFAWGDLVYYGRKNALARGDGAWTTYPRYLDAPPGTEDPFRLDLESDPSLKSLYRDAEAESGYLRDQNVFREDITIEDCLSVLIKYRTGAVASYSLNAFSPYEGFRVALTGDQGRIEYQEFHESHVLPAHQSGPPDDRSMRLRLQRLFHPADQIPILREEGGHGGGDPLIQAQMFSPHPPADPFHRNAGHEQGAASLLIGAAANRSIATGEPVRIDLLMPLKPGASRLSELI